MTLPIRYWLTSGDKSGQPAEDREGAAMSDTTYEIFQDRQSYRVKITRLGSLAQEAAGFASRDDAASWIARAKHLAATKEQKDPVASAHLFILPDPARIGK
jgi:hypothetical protein